MIAQITGPEWVAIISAATVLCGAVSAAAVSIIVALRKLDGKVDTLHATVNSLADKRVAEAQVSGNTQGRLDEKDAQQVRADIQAASTPAPGGLVVPVEVKVVNPPSDPVPTTDASSK